MSGFPKLKLIDRSAFPSTIRMPDISGYTGEVFALKTNPHWHEAEAGSYAWFDSYGTSTLPLLLQVLVTDTHLFRRSQRPQAPRVL